MWDIQLEANCPPSKSLYKQCYKVSGTFKVVYKDNITTSYELFKQAQAKQLSSQCWTNFGSGQGTDSFSISLHVKSVINFLHSSCSSSSSGYHKQTYNRDQIPLYSHCATSPSNHSRTRAVDQRLFTSPQTIFSIPSFIGCDAKWSGVFPLFPNSPNTTRRSVSVLNWYSSSNAMTPKLNTSILPHGSDATGGE